MPELRKRRVPVVTHTQLHAPGRATDRMSGPFKGIPREIRNGRPARTRHYAYRGTGYCMSEREAAHWLTEMCHDLPDSRPGLVRPARRGCAGLPALR